MNEKRFEILKEIIEFFLLVIDKIKIKNESKMKVEVKKREILYSYKYEKKQIGYEYNMLISNNSRIDKILSGFSINASNIEINLKSDIDIFTETIKDDFIIKIKNIGWGCAEKINIQLFDDHDYLMEYYEEYELRKSCNDLKVGETKEILRFRAKPDCMTEETAKDTTLFIRYDFDNGEMFTKELVYMRLYDNGFYQLGVGGPGPPYYESLKIDSYNKSYNKNFKINKKISKKSSEIINMRVTSDKSIECDCYLIFEFNYDEKTNVDLGELCFDVPLDSNWNHCNEKLSDEKVDIEGTYEEGFPFTLD